MPKIATSSGGCSLRLRMTSQKLDKVHMAKRTIRAFGESLDVWQTDTVMTKGPSLASRLSAQIADARAAWPGIALGDDVFVAFVGQRLGDDAELGSLSFVDLYLACACARRDPSALEAFEKRYAAEMRAVHARMKGVPFDGDEALQRMRQRLFVD